MIHARPSQRRARRRQRQEGVVLLVVLMMLLMATGTALYAMQSTFFEQKASRSIVEAAYSRASSECIIMAGIALEETGLARQGLNINWTAGAASAQSFPTKFTLPIPTAMLLDSPAVPEGIPTLPAGAQGFRCPNVTRPVSSHLLHERYQVRAADPLAGIPFAQYRTVISGFGELQLGGGVDANGVRPIHEVDSVTRAYFDK